MSDVLELEFSLETFSLSACKLPLHSTSFLDFSAISSLYVKKIKLLKKACAKKLSPSPVFTWLKHLRSNCFYRFYFIYLGFYVAFNTVQVIVGRAQETSTYSSLGFCTVNCRPTANNYQLSHLRPCWESNPSLRGGGLECYHSATMTPCFIEQADIIYNKLLSLTVYTSGMTQDCGTVYRFQVLCFCSTTTVLNFLQQCLDTISLLTYCTFTTGYQCLFTGYLGFNIAFNTVQIVSQWVP